VADWPPVAWQCVVCGFEFTSVDAGHRVLCDECNDRRPRTESGYRPSATRPGQVLVLELAAETANLRIAVEMAFRRLGMGLHGARCGLDTLEAAETEARGILERVHDAYVILGATRPQGKTAIPYQRSA
jgi:hypothetical protein